jgi:hypothetical protein
VNQPVFNARRVLWVLALLLAVLSMVALPARSLADASGIATQSLFDPARHMHVSEVHPGMKGYGLSVFSGTKIEKFDVEVVDVVKNFNPKYDVVLIRCPQEFLKNTGPIEGMSGSPIFLYDDSGKARMIGAFAYGWPFSKDCLAGVQPIEYMLKLSTDQAAPPPARPHVRDEHAGKMSASRQSSASPQSLASPRWSLDQVPLWPWNPRAARGRNFSYRSMLGSGDAASAAPMGMQPLATPLMTGGASALTMARIAPLFEGSGLVPMQAGAGTGAAAAHVDPPLEEGSVLAVPLLTGDMELTAVGTCTERIGNRIFGFGHSFNNEGPIALPAGSGSVAAIVANVETSFKLGFLSTAGSSLFTDQTVGVAGQVGTKSPMAPIELRIVYDDGSVDQTYHFMAAQHPKLTPVVAATAVMMALTGEKILPEYHTVDYDLNIEFGDHHPVELKNTSVNGDGTEIISDVALPLMATSDNPFAYVAMTRLTGTFHVKNTAEAAEILSVMVPQTKYEPGDTVKATISYLPFHAEEAVMPVEFTLPRNLPDGTYQFIVSDWTRYLEDEKTANPFKFSAQNVDELFSVLRDLSNIRHDAVYLRLVRQADGVAVGHTEMPHLPSSRVQVMMDSGRSDITPFVTSTVKIAPSGLVMSGSAEFSIEVAHAVKVETPSTGNK